MSPALSVVIPVRNDAARLGFLLGRLADLLEERAKELGAVEVVVVDDGSRDDTPAVAREMATAFEHFHLQALPWPCGRGVALRSAIASASGANAVLLDVNRPLDLPSVPFLVRMLEYADVVVSSGHDGGTARDTGRLAGAAQSLGRRLTASARVEVKALRTESAKLVFALIGAPGPRVDLQVSGVAASMGLRVLEMPVFWRQDGGRARRLDAGMTAALMWARTPRRKASAGPLPDVPGSSTRPQEGPADGQPSDLASRRPPKKASG